MRTNVKLMKVGNNPKEHFIIKIRGYTGKPEYKVVKTIVLEQKRISITRKALKKWIKDLQQRYPDKAYYLSREKVSYWLIDAKFNPCHFYPHTAMFWILGRKSEKGKDVPIYYSMTDGAFYVPSSYIRKKRRLVSSILSYRLRDLGVSHRWAYLS